MGFYSVVMLSSCALFACFVTATSQSVTVAPNMSTVKCEDWNNFATNSLLRNCEEERAPPAFGPLADFTAMGEHFVDWNLIKEMEIKRFSDTNLRPKDNTKKELVQYLLQAFQLDLWDEYHLPKRPEDPNDPEDGPKQLKDILKLFEFLSKHFGADLLAYVLVKLKDTNVPKQLAETYHQLYLKWMVSEEFIPSDVLEMWNKEGIPLSTVVKNLYGFIELYNAKSGTKTTVFKTIEGLFRTKKEMVRILSSLRREGGEIEKRLHTEMVESWVGKMTFDEVWKLVKPQAVNEKWNFYTIGEFCLLSRSIGPVNCFINLKNVFDGYDKLALVLAEAKQYDPAANDLQIGLVNLFLDRGFEVFVRELNLLEGELTKTNTEILIIFAHKYKGKYGLSFDWKDELLKLRVAHNSGPS